MRQRRWLLLRHFVEGGGRVVHKRGFSLHAAVVVIVIVVVLKVLAAFVVVVGDDGWGWAAVTMNRCEIKGLSKFPFWFFPFFLVRDGCVSLL